MNLVSFGEHWSTSRGSRVEIRCVSGFFHFQEQIESQWNFLNSNFWDLDGLNGHFVSQVARSDPQRRAVVQKEILTQQKSIPHMILWTTPTFKYYALSVCLS